MQFPSLFNPQSLLHIFSLQHDNVSLYSRASMSSPSPFTSLPGPLCSSNTILPLWPILPSMSSSGPLHLLSLAPGAPTLPLDSHL